MILALFFGIFTIQKPHITIRLKAVDRAYMEKRENNKFVFRTTSEDKIGERM